MGQTDTRIQSKPAMSSRKGGGGGGGGGAPKRQRRNTHDTAASSSSSFAFGVGSAAFAFAVVISALSFPALKGDGVVRQGRVLVAQSTELEVRIFREAGKCI